MSETAAPAPASPTQEAEITAALGRAFGRAGRHDGRRQVDHRPPAGGPAAPAVSSTPIIEIEAAAGMSIPDIFETHGEPHFRDGEARVIARLLDSGPAVLATGGGAFMREETRSRIRDKAVSIWLKADADVDPARVQAPRRPAAAADRGSRRRPSAGCSTRAIRSIATADLTIAVARRAARHDRRRMHRGACAPGCVGRRAARQRPTGSSVTP